VYVDGLWMDKTDVTNEEFAKFEGSVVFSPFDSGRVSCD
jgi:hypothetical protein